MIIGHISHDFLNNNDVNEFFWKIIVVNQIS